jgi:hypothetical protein
MSSPRRGSAGVPATDWPSTIMRDDNVVYEGLAIVDKFEQFVDYLYPILQSIPRKHGIVRDSVLTAMFHQVDLLIAAGKSRQASRLYAADADPPTITTTAEIDATFAAIATAY